ncbi:MAG: helix-turn-helix domain-containing protein [Paludibacter sp.]|nr:helix-turn-helix domain-containing protein [Paludibacter sp.]
MKDLIKNKMKRAVFMLKAKEYNISEIAYILGFKDPKYFSRCFKQYSEYSPSKYRLNVWNITSNEVINKGFIQQVVRLLKTKSINEVNSLSNEIAHDLNVSRSTLSRRIKQSTGLSPTRFFKKTRLDMAKDLLRNNSSIMDVAYQCGFKESNYFSKCFRSEFGHTPREYMFGNSCVKYK